MEKIRQSKGTRRRQTAGAGQPSLSFFHLVDHQRHYVLLCQTFSIKGRVNEIFENCPTWSSVFKSEKCGMCLAQSISWWSIFSRVVTWKQSGDQCWETFWAEIYTFLKLNFIKSNLFSVVIWNFIFQDAIIMAVLDFKKRFSELGMDGPKQDWLQYCSVSHFNHKRSSPFHFWCV